MLVVIVCYLDMLKLVGIEFYEGVLKEEGEICVFL